MCIFIFFVVWFIAVISLFSCCWKHSKNECTCIFMCICINYSIKESFMWGEIRILAKKNNNNGWMLKKWTREGGGEVKRKSEWKPSTSNYFSIFLFVLFVGQLFFSSCWCMCVWLCVEKDTISSHFLFWKRLEKNDIN